MSIAGKTYEADNRTGRNMEGPDANRPLERLTATSIIGDKVENLQGEDLGTIDNLMINIRTGKGGICGGGIQLVFGNRGEIICHPFDELRVQPQKMFSPSAVTRITCECRLVLIKITGRIRMITLIMETWIPTGVPPVCRSLKGFQGLRSLKAMRIKRRR